MGIVNDIDLGKKRALVSVGLSLVSLSLYAWAGPPHNEFWGYIFYGCAALTVAAGIQLGYFFVKRARIEAEIMRRENRDAVDDDYVDQYPSSLASEESSEASSRSPSVSSQASMPPVLLGGGGGVVPGNSVGYGPGGMLVGGAWQYANATSRPVSLQGGLIIQCQKCGRVDNLGRTVQVRDKAYGITFTTEWWCRACVNNTALLGTGGVVKEEPKHRIVRFRKKGG